MNFLSIVTEGKVEEIESLKDRRSLLDSINKKIVNYKIPIIAEFKRRSPTKRRSTKLNILEATKQMEQGGACAISVITDRNFNGTLEDLKKVKQNVNVPILRKDFIVDEFQLYESLAYGADAVLLIAKILKEKTKNFVNLADNLGLEALVEIHDEKDLNFAIDSNAKLLGVNNRDLRTLEVDLSTTEKIVKKIPEDRIIVAESGIKNKEDLRRMIDAGVDAVLIGTALMETESIEKKMREFTKVAEKTKVTRVKICGITNIKDAEFAVNAFADAIGIVNVAESKRFITLETARKIFNSVPNTVLKVVVTTPKNLKNTLEIEKIGATTLQIHGGVDIELLKEIKEKTNLSIVKQIAVDEKCFENIKKYENVVDMFLLDTIDTRFKTKFGGTGRIHDWSISRKIVKNTKKPIILAGGLNPENVGEAIKKVNPYMVDVASGVEKSFGIKSNNKVMRFIKNAKTAKTA